MSATTTAAPELTDATSSVGKPRSLRTPQPRTRRRSGRPGPGVGPVARPARAVSGPSLLPSLRGPVRSCVSAPEAEHRVPVAGSRWRLTDRGIAMVLVVGAMVVVAAITVVSLTAFRVTGSDFQPLDHQQSVQR